MLNKFSQLFRPSAANVACSKVSRISLFKRVYQGLWRAWWVSMQPSGRALREESEALDQLRDRWRR
ncbi:hypothetical protein R6242_01475 [Iodobacter sp. CM08]|uniref:hypothetical protein n=1 Tax=Iodobacter sp. CM08 TaxID=3085902 RepID=UPI0029828B26|nr:hypothetical protein [Iodobacter sp. CM08]MDW5415234.1 hypothetical protein [Iodobacter sp. CM08]